MYADDVQLYNTDSCINSINYDLQKIDNWATDNELGINLFKSNRLYISRNRKRNRKKEIDFVKSTSNFVYFFKFNCQSEFWNIYTHAFR